MKKLVFFLISFWSIILVIYYQKDITNFILREYVYKKELSIYQANAYSKKDDYNYIKHINNFYPTNPDDIKNAIYTILDSGMTEFSLFCSDEYSECLSDVEKISTDYETISNINNFVHPYNSYNKLYIATNTLGKINIKVEKLYSEQEIEEINTKIEEIKKNIITDKMNTRDKIKAFHDYVINNTVYDEERSEQLKNNVMVENGNQSHKANTVLNSHIALCSGYTDLMAIFLTSIKVPNYKIANDEHTWNAVYLDNNWYHLDLTWDDPVTSTGEDLLIYDFFLITTKQLEKINTNQHIYNKAVYGF